MDKYLVNLDADKIILDKDKFIVQTKISNLANIIKDLKFVDKYILVFKILFLILNLVSFILFIVEVAMLKNSHINQGINDAFIAFVVISILLVLIGGKFNYNTKKFWQYFNSLNTIISNNYTDYTESMWLLFMGEDRLSSLVASSIANKNYKQVLESSLGATKSIFLNRYLVKAMLQFSVFADNYVNKK